MKHKKESHLDRLYHYSIRKTSLGVGSVVVGVFLAGSLLNSQTVLADNQTQPPQLEPATTVLSDPGTSNTTSAPTTSTSTSTDPTSTTTTSTELPPSPSITQSTPVAVEAISLFVLVGENPQLPSQVTVFLDGENGRTEEQRTVQWDTASLSTATPGTYEITGQVEGTDIPAKASVRVAGSRLENVSDNPSNNVNSSQAFADKTKDQDRIYDHNRVYYVNDGRIDATNDRPKWSNWQNSERNDTAAVGVIFKKEGTIVEETIRQAEIVFTGVGQTETGTVKFPTGIVIEKYIGPADFSTPTNISNHAQNADHPFNRPENWQAVEATQTGQVANHQKVVYTFNPVSARAMRFKLTQSAPAKGMAIKELAFLAERELSRSSTNLKLKIDGKDWSKFDPNTKNYTVDYHGELPAITAQGLDNAAVTVIAPSQQEARTQIRVRSEAGQVDNFYITYRSVESPLKATQFLGLENRSAFVKVGENLALPSHVKTYYDTANGMATEDKTVQWSDVPEGALTRVGTFELTGRVEGLESRAKLTVRVSDLNAENVSANPGNDANKSRAIASITNDGDGSNDRVHYVNDGNLADAQRWTNWSRQPNYTRVDVGILFKDGGQIVNRTVNKALVKFYVDGGTDAPQDMVLERYIGPDNVTEPPSPAHYNNANNHPFKEDRNWEAVRLTTEVQPVAGRELTLNFDAVTTRALRLKMNRKSNKSGVAMTELAFYEPNETAHQASAVSLSVAGVSQNFNDEKVYEVTYSDDKPAVQLTASHNAAITRLDYAAENATVYRVVAEDGTHIGDYRVNYRLDVDKEPLREKIATLETNITDAPSIEGMTTESVNRYNQAKEAAIAAKTTAQDVLDNDQATQTQVNNQVELVNQANQTLSQAEAALAPDKSRLVEEIGKSGVVETDKFRNSASDLQSNYRSALDHATSINNKPDANVSEISTAVDRLTTAYNALNGQPTNKQTLQDKVNALETNINQAPETAGMTAETIERYNAAKSDAQNKLDAAKAILNKETATQAEVNAQINPVEEANSALTTAENGLRADKSALTTEIAEKTVIDSDKFRNSDESLQSAYRDALTEAERVRDDDTASVADVQTVTGRLNSARQALNGQPTNKQTLQDKVNALEANINQAPSTEGMTQATVEAYNRAKEDAQNKLDAAKAVLENNQATQAEVNAQITPVEEANEALTNAENGLTPANPEHRIVENIRDKWDFDNANAGDTTVTSRLTDKVGSLIGANASIVDRQDGVFNKVLHLGEGLGNALRIDNYLTTGTADKKTSFALWYKYDTSITEVQPYGTTAIIQQTDAGRTLLGRYPSGQYYTYANAETVTSTQNAENDRWEHVAVTFDQTARKVKFYRNGQLINEAAMGTDAKADVTSLLIGSHKDPRSDNPHPLRGDIDDIYTFDKVLTNDEVAKLYEDKAVPLAKRDQLQPVVNRLTALVEEAVDTEGMTPTSVQALEAAKEEARTTLAAANQVLTGTPTLAEVTGQVTPVTTALERLTQAKSALAPDKSGLQASINQETVKSEAKFYNDSTEDQTAYTTALDAAKAIKDKDNATVAEIREAKTALDTAYGNLNGSETNKEALTAKLSALRSEIDSQPATDGMTSDSVEAYQAAKTSAESKHTEASAVLTKPNVTQAEIDAQVEPVDQALQALTTAETDLTPDKSGLQSSIDKGTVKSEAKFYNDSTEDQTAYTAALEAAKAIKDKENATVAEIREAKVALDTAYGNLNGAETNKEALTAKLTALRSEIDSQPETDGMTADSIQAYEAAKTSAESKHAEATAVLTKPNVTQAEIDAQVTPVDQALQALTTAETALTPDKSGLQATIDQETVKTEAKFYNDSTEDQTAYTAALEAAKTIKDKDNATVAEIRDAKATLDTAYGNLDGLATNKEALTAKLYALRSEIDSQPATDGMTSESVEAYEAAKTSAESKHTEASAVLTKPNVTQAEIDARVEPVDQALQALTAAETALTPDKSGLQTSIDQETVKTQAKFYNDRTEDQTAYTSALEAAKAVNAKENATVAEIRDAKATLDTAYGNLDGLATNKEALTAKLSALRSEIDSQSATDGMTSDSIQAYEATKASAESKHTEATAVLTKPNVTQAEIDAQVEPVDQALQALTAAETALVPDKSGLQASINQETVKSEAKFYNDRTEDQTAYTSALEAAKAIKDKKNATVAEIREAKTALDTAYGNLNGAETNKEVLTAKLSSLRSELDSQPATDGMTSDSVQTYQSAKESAESKHAEATAVLNKSNVTQAEIDAQVTPVDQALQALTQAKSALTPDKSGLQSSIEQETVKSEAKFYNDSAEDQTAYTSALEAAKAVNAKENATVAEIRDAKTALDTAYGNLNGSETNKEELIALLEEIRGMDLTPYTVDSLTILQASLEAILPVAMSDTATQAEVDAALANLQSAHQGLTEKTSPEAPTNPDGGTDSGGTENTDNGGTGGTENPDTRTEVNKQELLAAIQEVTSTDIARFTEESLADYLLAAEAALAVAQNADATQTQVDQALESLRTARQNLVEKPANGGTDTNPGTTDPVDPAQPTPPVTTPEDPGTTEPTDPAVPTPGDATPAEPAEPTPPVTTPEDPGTTNPVEPAVPTPGDTTPAEPAEPATPAPGDAAPVVPTPGDTTPAEPTEPAQPTPPVTTPENPGTTEPAEPATPVPGDDTPTEPAQPTPPVTTPEDPGTTDPVDPAVPTPGDDTPAEPTDPAPAEPTEPAQPTPPVTTPENPGITEPAITVLAAPKEVYHADTEVRAILGKGEQATAAGLMVEKVETDETTEAASPAVPALADRKVTDYDLYDIEVVDAKGNILDIQVPATVFLPVNPDKDVDRVIYLKADGTAEDMDFSRTEVTAADGQVKPVVVFEAQHFSNYAVLYHHSAKGAGTSLAALPVGHVTTKGSGVTTPELPTGDVSAKLVAPVYTPDKPTYSLDQLLGAPVQPEPGLKSEQAVSAGTSTPLSTASQKAAEKPASPSYSRSARHLPNTGDQANQAGLLGSLSLIAGLGLAGAKRRGKHMR